MAENEISLQQKKERTLAAMACIRSVLEREKKTALINAEKSQQQMKEMYQDEKRKSWLGFGLKLILNFLAMVFLKADHHFLDFGKDSPDEKMKHMSENFVSMVSNSYADVFSLLESIIAQVNRSDASAEVCYGHMADVAINKQNAANAIISVAGDFGIFLRSNVREFMSSMRNETQVLKEIRQGVCECIYPEA